MMYLKDGMKGRAMSEWSPICHGCNENISRQDPYFCGSMCPPINTEKFGCSPHIYYCMKCIKKTPSYWPRPFI